jgi:hypothetical protein
MFEDDIENHKEPHHIAEESGNLEYPHKSVGLYIKDKGPFSRTERYYVFSSLSLATDF